MLSLRELTDMLAVLQTAKGIDDFIMELDFKLYGELTETGIDALLVLLDEKASSQLEDIYHHEFVSSFYPGVLLAPMIIRRYQVNIIEPNLDLVSALFVRKWSKKNILINAYSAYSEAEKDHLSQFKIAFTTPCPTNDCDQGLRPRSYDDFAKDF